MIIFYLKYRDRLTTTWTPDAMVMCVVYIICAMMSLSALCYLSKKSFKNLLKISEESKRAEEKAELLVEDGVSKVQDVLVASNEMVVASNSTNDAVISGGVKVTDLTEQMTSLKETMENVLNSKQALSDENNKISDILGSLQSITDQTNLLSLMLLLKQQGLVRQGKALPLWQRRLESYQIHQKHLQRRSE